MLPRRSPRHRGSRVASIFRPVGAALAALAGVVARLVRPLGAIAHPLKALLRDLAGLIPALLAGAGVFLVVAGLLNYFEPSTLTGSSPTDEAASPSQVQYSFPPLATPRPNLSGSPSPGASGTANLSIATRVYIPALNIDVPVVPSPPKEQYPLCNAAEYLSLDRVYGYPGAPYATYIYAHARVGMFWNLLSNSKVNNGSAMLTDYVEVFTDDNQIHLYQISKVIRHVPANNSFADKALAATTDELWLQTSEGHANSSTKLQIVATPIGVIASSYADAHPKNTATVCPDAPRCTAAGQGGCRR